MFDHKRIFQSWNELLRSLVPYIQIEDEQHWFWSPFSLLKIIKL